MKKLLIMLFILYITQGVAFAETDHLNPITPSPVNPIRIVYPADNARLPAIASTYVGGSAPADGKLTINGQPVAIHPGGGFLAQVALQPGLFTIRAVLDWNGTIYQSVRTVSVAEPSVAVPVSPLTIEYVTPEQEQSLLPGDLVKVICKASPGMTAHFTVQGVARIFPMLESAPGSGIYQGVYMVGVFDDLADATINVTVLDSDNGFVSKEAKGKLSRFPEALPVMAETTSANTVLHAGPQVASSDKAGYMMLLPKETLLRLTGKKGKEYRVRLNQSLNGWVNENDLKQLPLGTFPADVVIGNISLNARDNATLVRIPVSRRIPFRVDHDLDGRYVDIILYGAYSNTDWVNNAQTGCIQQVHWYQDDQETYRLRLFMQPNSWWGYDLRYEGKELVVELRNPPPLTNVDLPLNGLTIAVDAGHGSGGGAMGLTGYAEGDANLAIAFCLKDRLEAEGAETVMIRKDGDDLPLSQRTGIAWKGRADILISLHNNSLGPTGNPFSKRGYGVYYFTPMSLALAKEIHAGYRQTFSVGSQFALRDDGLYHANFAVTRTTQMPAVLTESAYMIVPEEEAYLKMNEFHLACAEAIVAGLKRYALKMRPEKT